MKKLCVALSLFAVMFGCMACTSETYAEYRVRIKEEYIAESATEPKGGIIFLGDSITDGYALEEFYLDYRAVNRGISGDTTSDVLDRIQETCLIMQPKIIVLLIGINNLSADGNSAFDGTEKILQEIFKADQETKVIVQSLYPLNKTTSKTFTGYGGAIDNDMVVHYNRRLQPLAEEYGCTYVDMYSGLIDGDGNFDVKYTYDGLHPIRAGYEVITNKLKPILNGLAKECGII